MTTLIKRTMAIPPEEIAEPKSKFFSKLLLVLIDRQVVAAIDDHY